MLPEEEHSAALFVVQHSVCEAPAHPAPPEAGASRLAAAVVFELVLVALPAAVLPPPVLQERPAEVTTSHYYSPEFAAAVRRGSAAPELSHW